jgi:hypothetical protein
MYNLHGGTDIEFSILNYIDNRTADLRKELQVINASRRDKKIGRKKYDITRMKLNARISELELLKNHLNLFRSP